MWPNRPVSNIVAAGFHTVDDNLAIGTFGKVCLHGFVSTGCVADQDSEVLFYDVVESFSLSRGFNLDSAREPATKTEVIV